MSPAYNLGVAPPGILYLITISYMRASQYVDVMSGHVLRRHVQYESCLDWPINIISTYTHGKHALIRHDKGLTTQTMGS